MTPTEISQFSTISMIAVLTLAATAGLFIWIRYLQAAFHQEFTRQATMTRFNHVFYQISSVFLAIVVISLVVLVVYILAAFAHDMIQPRLIIQGLQQNVNEQCGPGVALVSDTGWSTDPEAGISWQWQGTGDSGNITCTYTEDVERWDCTCP